MNTRGGMRGSSGSAISGRRPSGLPGSGRGRSGFPISGRDLSGLSASGRGRSGPPGFVTRSGFFGPTTLGPLFGGVLSFAVLSLGFFFFAADSCADSGGRSLEAANTSATGSTRNAAQASRQPFSGAYLMADQSPAEST